MKIASEFFKNLFFYFTGIMFSLARRRREAERHKKLEDQFNKADTSGNGKITAEQMVKIFEDNEVVGKYSVLKNTKFIYHLAGRQM